MPEPTPLQKRIMEEYLKQKENMPYVENSVLYDMAKLQNMMIYQASVAEAIKKPWYVVKLNQAYDAYRKFHSSDIKDYVHGKFCEFSGLLYKDQEE